MTQAGAIRLAMSRWIAEHYAQRPGLDALIVAGAVARNRADEQSSLPLLSFWSASPDEADRLEPIRAVGGRIVEFREMAGGRWSESYLIEGVQVDMVGFASSTAAAEVRAVVRDYDPNWKRQPLLSALEHGVPLFGEARVRGWQNLLQPYPPPLAVAVAQRAMTPDAAWRARHALARRGDVIALSGLLHDAARRLCAALYARNETYVPHPYFTRLTADVEEFAWSPPYFVQRLGAALREPTAQGVLVMDRLAQEVCDGLQDAAWPGLDVDALRRAWARERGG